MSVHIRHPVHQAICEAHRAAHGRKWETVLACVRTAVELLPSGNPRRSGLSLRILRSWFGRKLSVAHLAGASRHGDSLARAFAHAYVHVAGDLWRARQSLAARLILERCEVWLVAAERSP